MSVIEIVALSLTGLFVLAVILRIFKTPLKLLLRLICNTALGFAGVWLLNLTSGFTGLSLGMNWFNALTVGVLGLPGFLLLLLTRWVLGT